MIVVTPFESVTHSPPGDGKLRGALRRCFSRFASAPRLFSGTRDFAGFCNFCRVLPGWSFGALAQPRKQSSRRFTQGLHPLLSVALLHAEQHEPGALECLTKVLKEPTK